MQLEHSPARSETAINFGRDGSPHGPPASDYWDGLIDEKTAAKFYDVKPRSMQNWRQKGGGPPFVAISSRCIKYTRRALKIWADQRIRTSTSDDGRAA